MTEDGHRSNRLQPAPRRRGGTDRVQRHQGRQGAVRPLLLLLRKTCFALGWGLLSSELYRATSHDSEQEVRMKDGVDNDSETARLRQSTHCYSHVRRRDWVMSALRYWTARLGCQSRQSKVLHVGGTCCRWTIT